MHRKKVERTAKAIRRRKHREEEEARAGMVAQNRSTTSAKHAAEATASDASGGPKASCRNSLDVFHQFIAPDVAKARNLDNTLPVVNTLPRYDRGAPADSLSRRSKPPPVPSLRTFTL